MKFLPIEIYFTNQFKIIRYFKFCSFCTPKKIWTGIIIFVWYKNNIYKTKVVIKNEVKHTIVREIMRYVAEAKRQITQDCCSSLLLSHFWNTASLKIYSFFFLGFSNITFSIIFFSTKFCLRNEASIFLSRTCLAPSFSFIISSVTLSFSLLDCKSS